MQLASSTHIPDSLMVAMTLLSEKPRLGFERSTVTLHPGFEPGKSLTALRDNRSVVSGTYQTHVMGRFMSPDYSGIEDGPPDAIAYGDPSNPQRLNLYSYVQNNPLSSTDPDGHDCIYGDGFGGGYVQTGDCTNPFGKDDNGIFVNGTVDASSFKYNASNNSYSFSFTPDGAGPDTIGRGFIQGPNLNGGFDPGSLGAAVFGAQNASTFNNAAGVVNAVGGAEIDAAGLFFPLTHLAVSVLSGRYSPGVTAAGIARKPGTLGQFGSTNAENKIAADIVKQTGADKKVVHQLLQEGSADRGRALSFREGLEYVREALGLIE